MAIQFNPFQLQEMQAAQSQGNMFMNFLQNAVLQKISQNFQEKQLDQQQKQQQMILDANLAMKDIVEVPEDTEGAARIGDKTFAPKPMSLQPITYGDKLLGYAVRDAGQTHLIQPKDGTEKPVTMDQMSAQATALDFSMRTNPALDTPENRARLSALRGSLSESYDTRSPMAPQVTQNEDGSFSLTVPRRPTSGGGMSSSQLPGFPQGQVHQPPASFTENMSQQFNSLEVLGSMKNILSEMPDSKTGRVAGWVTKRLGWAGLDEKAVEFDNLRNQFKLSAQSMIKGIPSNFDVQTVIDTLPDLNMPKKTAQDRIELAEKLNTELIKRSIGYWKTTAKAIPEYLINQAAEYGIDANQIPAWNGKGVAIDKNEIFKAVGIKDETKTSSKSTSDKDGFGYTIGEKRVLKNGKTATYIGNNQWQF